MTATHPAPEPATNVLADRMAAALVHREPGWKLPRRSALARRFDTSVEQIGAAVDELVRRSFLRRLPDGEVYRSSPAEYRISIEGVAGLGASVDPMGMAIVCRDRHVLRLWVPRDISPVLGLAVGRPVRGVRCLWACGDAPAAVSTTYLPGEPPDSAGDGGTDTMPTFDTMLGPPATVERDGPDRARTRSDTPARAAAAHVELRPPQPSTVRMLRLAPGQPAIVVAVRFDDATSHTPTALTTAALRPDLFRVVVETDNPPAH